MATHSSILAWRIPQRSLAAYSPQGCKELDMTEETWPTQILHIKQVRTYCTAQGTIPNIL